MMAACAPLDAATGEPLYDVFNDRGLALLLGVTRAQAYSIIDQHQAEDEPAARWLGDMLVQLARRGPGVLRTRVSVTPSQAGLMVYCEVDRFLPSGLTVPELSARLRPQLVQAIHKAAAHDPGGKAPARPVSVQMDVGAVDPSIMVAVHGAVACMSNIDNHLQQLQALLARMVGANAAGSLA